MDTKNFRTKTEYIERNNGKVEGIWEIGLDIGYSGVKSFSSNSVSCFPAYAKKIDNDFAFASVVPDSSIMYKDLNNGNMWIVGEVAQNIMATGDTSDSEASLYGRERYFNQIFQVIARTGLGLSMLDNEFGAPLSDKIVVQTGLPERYMSDESDIIDALEGDYAFALKIGKKDWKEFRFKLNKENIFVMSQPKGTLFSICINKNGSFHPDAEKYLSSSILVFDAGFGTLDFFPIINGVVGHGETKSDLGMKRVLQETCKGIKEAYGVRVDVPSMQKYLETGLIKEFDRKTLKSSQHPFSKQLTEASRIVCDEAIEYMMSAFNLIDYEYLVVTGGTGAAWLDQIRNRFKDTTTLKIINGNQNDNLPFIYSNVRGYYLYRYNKLWN